MSMILRWWTRQALAAVLDWTTAVAARRTIPPWVLAALLAVVLLAATGPAVLGARSPGHAQPAWVSAETAQPSPSPSPTPVRTLPEPKGAIPIPSPPPVWLVEPAGDFVGWAVLDLDSDFEDGDMTITASSNATETSTTASMIKVWIAADYLRRVAETGGEPSPGRLTQLTQVIRDSDNAYAEAIFQELGAHESIERLIDICGLPYARAVPNRWSNTLLSPVDTALMGRCIADGRAAGPEWTDWLLNEMRSVRGIGDFGIRDALPPEQRSAVAIKNGWVVRKDQNAWHVNCLAVGDTWTMGVMTRYPADLGYEYGAEICRSLAAENLPAAPVDPGQDQPESGPQFS
jgi:hypothetical protein